MLYICDAYHIRGSSKPASISVAGIFLSAAVADIRFRTPVGSINVSPASSKWYATGQAGPFFLEYPSKLLHIIMEEDVNRVSAVDMEAPGRVANQLSIEEKQKLMEYYSKQLEMMYPIASPGMTDKAGLVTLQKRNTRLIEM